MEPTESRTLIQSLLGALQALTPGTGLAQGGRIEELNSDPESDQDERDPRVQVQEDQDGHAAQDNEQTQSSSVHRSAPASGIFAKNITNTVTNTDPRIGFSEMREALYSHPPYVYHPTPAETEMRERLSRPPQRLLYENEDNEPSVRKSLGDPKNVTARDSKRPKERKRDTEYRRMTLSSADFPTAVPNPAGFLGVYGQSSARGGASSPSSSVPSPLVKPGIQSPSNRVFKITLICTGRNVRRQVYESMAVAVLMEEAGAIFGLDPSYIVLMLFTLTPMTLPRNGLISGPRVEENATVFVFTTQGVSQADSRVYHPHSSVVLGNGFFHHQSSVPSTAVSSKLLSSFKLPTFDGSPRHWKTWDRSLQRFLGLHQLDHVLLDDFLALLPHPDAVNANKVVYFLIEETVAIGTLAANYVRQAPKWNGHAAYLLLYNRFVFSGPQTAAVLLAELTSIRFLRDETASEFCMHLVELLEELETVPGTSAVCMNDTQKLGYLLSGIRHESDLQSVYVQLQATNCGEM
jgi:hypothetical protein